MQATTTHTPEAIYALALEAAKEAAANFEDNGYGCGTSFVTIKWGTPFMRWAKKQGLVRKDGYYGWILDTEKHDNTSGTLAQENFNEAFAAKLRELDVHAFNHTYLN